MPLGAEGIAMTPDGKRLCIGCNRSEAMVAFDLGTNKVARQLECPGFQLRVRVSLDGKLAVASCPMRREVAVFTTDPPAEAGGEIVRIDLATLEVSHRRPSAGPIADAVACGLVALPARR